MGGPRGTQAEEEYGRGGMEQGGEKGERKVGRKEGRKRRRRRGK